MRQPIKRKAHGAIDYGFMAWMFTAPSLLGLRGSARWLPAVFGATQGALNALTDQPLALEREVPFRDHGKLEAASGPAFVVAPMMLNALNTSRGRAFFGASLAMLATVYTLTDWNAGPE